MKLCFMFINRDDCKKVERFLANEFNVERDNYLGYDTLSIPLEQYEQAVIRGIDFIITCNIRTAWWVDKYGQRTTVDSVPLLFAEIPHTFKHNKFLRKIAQFLCSVYAKNYEKRLEKSILIHYTPCYNVEFRLARNNEAVENHQYYTEEITKYCLGHYHIFNYISVCDAFGKIITVINRNHSVEWPITNRPR